MPASPPQQIITQSVNEDHHGAACRGERQPGPQVRHRAAERRRHRGQHITQMRPLGSAHGITGTFVQLRRPAVAADRALAKAAAARTASAPSAAADSRTVMSSAARVPVYP